MFLEIGGEIVHMCTISPKMLRYTENFLGFVNKE